MPHFLLPIWLCRPRLWEREPGLGRLHGRLSCQAEKSVKVWPLPVRRLWTSASLLPRPPQEIRVIGFPFSKPFENLVPRLLPTLPTGIPRSSRRDCWLMWILSPCAPSLPGAHAHVAFQSVVLGGEYCTTVLGPGRWLTSATLQSLEPLS